MDEKHKEHELEKQVEALIDWLRSVSLMDQLSVIDANTIRAAIEKTNYMVINRLKASCSVKFKKTKNITVWGETEKTTYGAKIVSMAPELSLSTIGGTIPVIEIPDGIPMPETKEVAALMTLIGHMVVHREVPKQTLAGLGDATRSVPNTYRKGKEALAYCANLLQQFPNYQ